MKITIWITHISHRHGDDLYASMTPEAADQIVRDYVEDWWDHEKLDIPKPLDPVQMVEDYFEMMDDESYQIQEAELEMGLEKILEPMK